MSKSIDMTRGPIVGPLIRFILPLVGSSIFQQLYNTVDFLFVGNFLDKTAAAAVGASATLITCTIGLFSGISVGTSVVASQAIGAGDRERAEKALHSSVTFGLLGGLVLMTLGILFAPALLRLLRTPENVIPQATTYLRIIFLGTCGNVIYNGANGMLRGLGDAKFPMVALVFSALLNIALDMLFVIVFHWDVAGVAWATIIAHLFSGLLMIWKQNTGVYGAKIDFRNLRMDKNIMKLILKLGLPAAVQNATFSVGSLIIQSFSNRFGVN